MSGRTGRTGRRRELRQSAAALAILLWISLAWPAQAQSIGGACSVATGSAVLMNGMLLICNGSTWTLGEGFSSSGNVGIGTTSPGYTLDVNGAINAQGNSGYLRLTSGTGEGSGSDYWIGRGDAFGGSNGTLAFYAPSSSGSGLEFGIANSAKMVMNSSGYVGIGTASPTSLLEVKGMALADNGVRATGTFSTDLASSAGIDETGNTMRLISWGVSGTYGSYNFLAQQDTAPDGSVSRMYINSSGNVGIGTTGPGATLEVNGTLKVDSTATYSGAITTSSPYIYLDGATGTVNSTGGPFIYGDANNTVMKIGSGGGGLAVQNYAGITEAFLATSGNSYIVGGNVGIGTTSPQSTLDVAGNIVTDAGGNLSFQGVNNNNGIWWYALNNASWGRISRNTSTGALQIDAQSTGYPILLNAYNSGGDVGIGTTSPGYTLDVSGTGRFTGILGAGQAPIAATTSDIFDAADLSIGASENGAITLDFGMYYSSGWKYAASTYASALRTDGAGNLGFLMTPSSGTAGASASPSQVMTLGSSGNLSISGTLTAGTNAVINGGGSSYFNGGSVGIATTSPGYTLQVNGTAMFGSGGSYIAVGSNSGTPGCSATYSGITMAGSHVWDNCDGGLHLTGGGGWIELNGNVGIGVSGPSYTLQVAGNGYFSSALYSASSILSSTSGSNWFGLEPEQTESPAHGSIVNSGAIRLIQFDLTSPYTAAFYAGASFGANISVGSGQLATNGDTYLAYAGEWMSTALGWNGSSFAPSFSATSVNCGGSLAGYTFRVCGTGDTSGTMTAQYFFTTDGSNGLVQSSNGTLFLRAANGTVQLDQANLYVNNNIFWGTGGNWLSAYLNQAVLTSSSPTFSNLTIGANIVPGVASNSGGGTWYFGNAAWGGDGPATSGINSVTGFTYSGGSGSQLFTVSSGPGQASFQLDGSIFIGDNGSPYNPIGMNGTSDGYLLVDNSASVGGSFYVNGNIYMSGGGEFQGNGDHYMAWAGVWASSWLNQNVTAGSSPNFYNPYIGYMGTNLSNWVNQSVTTGASPTFANVYVNCCGIGWLSNILNQAVLTSSQPTFSGVYISGGGSSDGIFGGNGDQANFSNNDLQIQSWWGVGFRSSCCGNPVTYPIAFDTRSGYGYFYGGLAIGTASTNGYGLYDTGNAYFGSNIVVGSGQLATNGDVYIAWAGVWASSWVNQSVTNGASPTFGNVYLNYGPGWISNWLNQNVANGASPTFGNIYLNYGPGWISNWLNQCVTTGCGPTFAGLNVNGNIYDNGSLLEVNGSYIYPGRNDGGGNYQTSWYFASNGSYGLYTNTNLYASGDLVANGCMATGNGFNCGGQQFYDNGNAYITGNIYWGTGGNWLSAYLNQSVTSGASPTFNNLYLSYQGNWLSTMINTGCVTINWSGYCGYQLNVNGNSYTTGSSWAANYWHTSDRRLKTDIKPIAGLDIVEKLNGVQFNWKKDGTASAGVIAQDVQKVMPEAVTVGKDGMESVSYDALLAPMIESIKQLKVENDTLKADNDNLKATITVIKADNDNLSAEEQKLQDRVDALERARRN